LFQKDAVVRPENRILEEIQDLAREGQMNLRRHENSEVRFAAYVEGLASVIGHADRTGPLRDYCTGLMLPGERKSVETDGGADGTSANGGTAPVAAALCQQRMLVG
jgi:hypothetical protein